jgi:hypothetical protein
MALQRCRRLGIVRLLTQAFFIIFAIDVQTFMVPTFAKPDSDPPVLFFAAVGAKQVVDRTSSNAFIDELFNL